MHYIMAVTGFSTEVDQMLVHAAKVGSCPECEKYVILLIDEMHVHEELVYDKHTGELISFANLEDVNQHLLAFEELFFMYNNVGWCVDKAATKVIRRRGMLVGLC